MYSIKQESLSKFRNNIPAKDKMDHLPPRLHALDFTKIKSFEQETTNLIQDIKDVNECHVFLF